jgi:hypothetical protein
MKRAPFVLTTTEIVTVLPLTLHQHVKSEFAAEPTQARFSFDVLGVTSTSTPVEVGLSAYERLVAYLYHGTKRLD